MIPYGKQDVTAADRDAVIEALTSDLITQGPRAPAFAQALADRVGAEAGVAVNSATSALHIAVAALGLKPGGLLWTSPNTFVATANVARYCGAQVDFVDIDPATRNMCAEALERKLAEATRPPDVVAPVHFAGRSADMVEIAALARGVGARIVEDASHAVGGAYAGRPIGCCAWSDICVFSFHPVKIITTAEGGAALANDVELVDRMRRLSSHGVTRDPALMSPRAGDPPAWVYEQIELGFNYRMTELQAALGLSQLERLDAYVRRRRALAERYHALLEDMSDAVLRPVLDSDRSLSAWHLYVIELRDRTRRDAVFRRMRAAGIGVNAHYIPVHTQPYYRRLGFKDGDFPVAERYFAGALTLPLHPGLTEAEQDAVVAALGTALGDPAAPRD